MLDKGQAAGLQSRQAFLVLIIDIDAQSGVGEREDKWNPDVTRAADDSYVAAFHSRQA